MSTQLTIKETILMTEKQMKKYLSSLTPSKTDNENYWFFERKNSKVCLVAHIDTVRRTDNIKIVEKYPCIHAIDYITGNQSILGADDRAGVYACLKFLERNDVSVLFTNGEESGGTGVLKFIRDHKNSNIFNNTNIFIELDRRGKLEYVTYNPLPLSYSQIMFENGFERNQGTFSDIKYLTQHFDVPSVNISIGYNGEHTTHEYLNLIVLDRMIHYCGNLISVFSKI